MTDPAERDWFGPLGDGLVVVLLPPPGPGAWSTATSAWLHISPAGQVTAFTGKVDVGQDNRTALRLLVAEELGVPLASVRLAMGDTDLCPYDMGTFGSRSMPDAGQVLRRTAAYARTLLPPVVSQPVVSQPVVSQPVVSQPVASQHLAGQRRVEVVAGEPALTDPATWQTAGRPHLPPGARAAVTGGRRFGSDLSHPGLWHGAVLRPPAPGATLRALDAAAAAARPDVTVVSTPGLAGVVAPGQAEATAALADLAAGASWDVPAAPSDHEVAAFLREHPTQGTQTGRWGGPFLHQEGSAATALESAAIRCEATYTAAYIAPAALETRVAVAEWDHHGLADHGLADHGLADHGLADHGQRVTVWTGTQTPFAVRAQVAEALGIGEPDVRIIVPATGGAFGGKHAGGIAAEAAILAREAGRPVKVHWSRAEEFTAGTLRPAAVIDVAAGLGAGGAISGWTFTNINSGAPGIWSPYRIADQRLEYQPAASPLPQASYRALAATANTFARESMIDELAQLAGRDPVEFRLANLADERLAAVLLAVAGHIGWEPQTTGPTATLRAANYGAGVRPRRRHRLRAGEGRPGRHRSPGRDRPGPPGPGHRAGDRLRVRRDRQPGHGHPADRGRHRDGIRRRDVRGDPVHRRRDHQRLVLGVPGAAARRHPAGRGAAAGPARPAVGRRGRDADDRGGAGHRERHLRGGRPPAAYPAADR